MEASPTTDNRSSSIGLPNRVLTMQPDAVLCALSARGNEDAFGVLYLRYRQQVFAFVFHLLGRSGSIDDAEDLTQEIMQKAYENLHTRNRGGSFKAWLFKIARNHTFDHVRARKPSTLSIDEPFVETGATNVISLSAEVERRAEFSWLMSALSALPDRQREALVMRELGGASTEEIAEKLETTPEGAKQLIKRARSVVSTEAEAKGVRRRNLGSQLAAAAPITAIGWLGAAKTSAAATAGSAAAAGAAAAGAGSAAAGGAAAGGVGAAVGGVGIAAVGGKVAATVLAVAAITTGGVVATEQLESRGSEPAAQRSQASERASGSAPAQSLVVGAAAAERAKQNKIAANQRRARAKKRASERRARAKAKRAAARTKAKQNRGKGIVGSKGRAKSKTPPTSNSGGSNNSVSKPTPPAPPGGGNSGGGSGKPTNDSPPPGNSGGNGKNK